MPLFEVEENRIANGIGVSDLTIWLHTDEPTDADPTLGRVTVGGGVYESGATLAAADISDAATGDISNDVDVDFVAADEAAGTVVWCSAYRGANPVGKWPLPSTTIANGDSFKINSGTLNFNGSST